jgi:WD40 repeat protein
VIGEGSYGQVWLARSATGAYRAIKVVRRQLSDEGRGFHRAFQGLLHYEPISRTDDSLMDVLHVGPVEPVDHFYCVMELADPAPPLELDRPQGWLDPLTSSEPEQPLGRVLNPETYVPRTLRLMLDRQGRLPVAQCVELGLALGRALEGLHRRGLVHRDVKPSNIIFAGGRPKLTDIDLVTRPESTLKRVVAEGFSPPEGAGSPGADVYSLGKVLYEASTSLDRTQFPIPPVDLDPEETMAWADLNEVLLRACAFDPARRYGSVTEMLAELQLLVAGRSVRRLRVLERRQRWLLRLGVAAALALVLVGFVAVREVHHARRWQSAADESHSRLRELQLSHAQHALEDHQWHQATLWQVHALEAAEAWPASSAEISDLRWRIGTLESWTPRLIGLGEHENAINELAFSPDGQWFVTASEDGTAQVWEANTGQPIGPRLRHEQGINDVRFGPDSQWVATASLDGTLGIWDVPSGRPRLPPLQLGGEIWCLAIDPTGQRIAAGGQPGNLRIWDATTGEVVATPPPHHRIWWIAFSPDGQWLVSVGEDRMAQVVSTSDGTHRFPPLMHPDQVRHAAFSPDGQRLLTACRDGVARFWNAVTGEPEALEIRHLRLNYAGFDHAGRRVVTATGGKGEPSEARVWDATTGQPVGLPLRHDSRIRYAVFSPDDKWLAAASHDGWAQVARVGSDGKGIHLGHGGYVWALAFSPDGQRLLTAGRESVWRLWDLGPHRSTPMSYQPTAYYKACAGLYRESGWAWAGNDNGGGAWKIAPDDQVTEVAPLPEGWLPKAMDPDGRHLALVDGSFSMQAWCLDIRQPAGPTLSHPTNLMAAAWHPHRPWLATGDVDGVVRVWDPFTGEAVAGPFVLPNPPVGHLVFSHQGHFLAISTGGYTAQPGSFTLLETATFQPVGGIRTDPDAITVSAFSPDDDLVAVAVATYQDTRPGRVFFVKTETGQGVLRSLPHDDGVSHVAFSTDGRWLASSDEEGDTQVWSVPDLQPHGPPMRSQRSHPMTDFHPGGRHLAVASQDGSVAIWDWASGQLPLPRLQHGASVSVVQWYDQGHRLLTATAEGEVRLWPFNETREPVDRLRARAELEAGVALAEGGQMLPLSPEELLSRMRFLQNNSD